MKLRTAVTKSHTQMLLNRFEERLLDLLACSHIDLASSLVVNKKLFALCRRFLQFRRIFVIELLGSVLFGRRKVR